MSYAEDKPCDTAEEFIEYFQRNPAFRTRNEYSANYMGINGYIFRGQCDAAWKLIPQVFRGDRNHLYEFTPQTADHPPPDTDPERRSWLGWQLHAELRAMFLFLEAADRLGIFTPIAYTNINEHNELIASALKQQESDAYDTDFPSAQTLNQLALAQHHRVPTRLLDWTESPYIAAYFAAYKASLLVDDATRIKSERIAVFAMNTIDIAKHAEKLMVVNVPRHNNSFLRAQRGLFTHMPRANRYFLGHKEWPSIEDVVDGTPGLDKCLMRVSLPSSETRALLRLLYDMDITRHSLMPSLDNSALAYSYRQKLFRRAEAASD